MTTIILDPRPDPAKSKGRWLTVLHSCGHRLAHKVNVNVTDNDASDVAAALAVQVCVNCRKARKDRE